VHTPTSASRTVWTGRSICADLCADFDIRLICVPDLSHAEMQRFDPRSSGRRSAFFLAQSATCSQDAKAEHICMFVANTATSADFPRTPTRATENQGSFCGHPSAPASIHYAALRAINAAITIAA
jgi:hypothetical protein